MANAKKSPTLVDLAKAAKISKSAASMAMADSASISEDTKRRVREIALKIGYRKNELLSSMMSSIKKKSKDSFRETIALINGNPDERAFETHDTLHVYLKGIREEAERLGYTANDFWLWNPEYDGKSLERVLKSRGIRGGMILGHVYGNSLPAKFDSVWRNFYFLSVGIKTCNPALETVSADNYAIARLAAVKLVEKGFLRPALVLDEHIDDLVDGTFVSGFWRIQMKFPANRRIAPFLLSESAPDYGKKLAAWVEKNRPDAIVYLMNSTRRILEKIPAVKNLRIRLVQLENRGETHNWAGVEQNNERVGKIAMRRLADMLSRYSACVADYENISTFIPPDWVDSD